MKKLIVLSVCAGFVLLSALGSGVWAGPAIQVPAATYGFECGDSQILDVSTQGNKTYLKLLNRGPMVSEDSRLTGDAVVEVEAYINNVNGHINAHGSLVLTSLTHAGGWEADFNIQVPGGQTFDVNGIMIMKDSQMNARGTGVFEDQWFFFSHGVAVSPPPYDIPVTGPAGCDFVGEIWSGFILNPNAT